MARFSEKSRVHHALEQRSVGSCKVPGRSTGTRVEDQNADRQERVSEAFWCQTSQMREQSKDRRIHTVLILLFFKENYIN